MNIRLETATLSPDEIMDAVEGALQYARERFGQTIDAKSLDLRLWAAASLIQSAYRASIKATVLRSLSEKLDFIERTQT